MGIETVVTTRVSGLKDSDFGSIVRIVASPDLVIA